MTLPGICPMCKSTKTRKTPKGMDALTSYRPPRTNLRMVGAGAEQHNKDAVTRIHDAQENGGLDIVICADCGAIYAREFRAGFDVKTPPVPAPAHAAPPEKAKKTKGGGK